MSIFRSHRAVEILEPTVARAPMVITCEHASNWVPARFSLQQDDLKWLSDHWGWDVGALNVATRLGRLTRSPVVFSRFSRLLIDVNRPLEHNELIRRQINDSSINFNQSLSDDAVEHRVNHLFRAYHSKVDRVIETQLRPPNKPWLFSIHSFTPEMPGEDRWMELGVLFNAWEDRAHALADGLKNEGFQTALNQPYSGYNNYIYSADRHGNEHDIPYLELEVRNDLIDTETGVDAVTTAVYNVISRLGWV